MCEWTQAELYRGRFGYQDMSIRLFSFYKDISNQGGGAPLLDVPQSLTIPPLERRQFNLMGKVQTLLAEVL